MADSASTSSKPDWSRDFGGFAELMPNRILKVLLVSSLYESFILESEGLVSELITTEYMDMNLTHPPRVTPVSTPEAALKILANERFDLVITMTRLRGIGVPEFAERVQELHADLPVVVLADEPRELVRQPEIKTSPHISRVFVWTGDAKMLLAIIKLIEDALNVEQDIRTGNVRIIILVENSVRFYSSYLPLIYTELMKLTQSLMAEGINLQHRLLRQRARPRILLAETFEEAIDLYEKFSENMLGVISDVRFPRNGQLDPEAGLEFTRRVRADSPHLPVMLQSSEPGFAGAALELQAHFLHKQSRRLLQDLRDFIVGSLGFGDFVFTLPDGTEVGRAQDLRSLEEILHHIPEESLEFHASHNHISNWLMARTEFELAASLRPKNAEDFASMAELRTYLLETLATFREQSQTGVIADFSPAKFDVATSFTRIGSGSIGGKARGLAFINSLILRNKLAHRFENVSINVPRSAAVGTDVFDTFLDQNNLHELISRDPSEEEVINAFLAAKLPSTVNSDLTAFLNLVRYPLAVRSSSLLEDSQDRPFAGIYTTHMLPNNHPDLAVRRDQLCDAIKLVYASTFFPAARRYLLATGRHSEEEKMGVILQELVGSPYGERFYPTFSGVARSYNYYPTNNVSPEQGVACVALGLGKTVVEGGESLIFSPAQPRTLPQFATITDTLANSQRTFYALDMSHPSAYPDAKGDAHMLKLELEVAEEDGTLAPIGSVYSAENDAIYDGIFRPGPRLVTFAHVLKSGLFPLADILQLLLKIGEEGMACPVEIEFAVNMSSGPMKFGFLQIRPTITNEEHADVQAEEVSIDQVLCESPKALGNGHFTDVHDVVYVKPEAFDPAKTLQIASELAQINDKLSKAGRRCLLIGPGRWGSADHWLGVPVSWEQISTAQVIIETSLKDFLVTPSQGTHFFQNITSMGVGYFAVDPATQRGFIDWAWLAEQEEFAETQYIRGIRSEHPFDVRIDGRNQRGTILKPHAEVIPTE